MRATSKYWMWVRIDVFGNCQTEELLENRAFLEEEFSQLALTGDVPHREIQRQLVEWVRAGNSRSQMAEKCLHCFISNQIKDICLQLEQRFGTKNDFSSAGLLPSVLDNKLAVNNQSLTARILSTFDPDKGSLSTWTIRIFKSYPAVKRFLLEHGVEQVTDWMLLNYMTLGRLERILTSLQRTPLEIQQALQLLDSYHQVYRVQLLQHRKSGARSRYPEPTLEQLQQMRLLLPSLRLAEEDVLKELQALAGLLREERIRTKTNVNNKQSAKDVKPTQSKSQVNLEQLEFLTYYDSQFNTCLAKAVKKVIEARVEYLQGNKTEKSLQKAETFIQALRLFHCDGVPMKEMAPSLPRLLSAIARKSYQ